jgi:hypothetical protein
MDKQLRKAQGAERLNIMYAISKLLRLAKRELKNKSKYGECRLVCVGSAKPRGQLRTLPWFVPVTFPVAALLLHPCPPGASARCVRR